MRPLRGPLLVVATLSLAPLAVFAGCKDEKSGAEKRAEELAASASAAKASASAAASQVDPAEQKYLARKKALEQTVRDLKADEGRIMAGDKSAVAGVLRKYSSQDSEGEKLAKALEEKRKKDGKDGYRLKQLAGGIDIRLEGSMEQAEVDVTEETTAKNSSACLLYVQKWKWVSDKWTFAEQKSVQKVDCPSG